jgi:hypothetical protein
MMLFLIFLLSIWEPVVLLGTEHPAVHAPLRVWFARSA